MKVLGFGDNVCDEYVHLHTMFPGGQALNFAVYAKMLGVESAFMGVFGTDGVAQHVQATLDEFGIDRSHCRQYEGENGHARVTLVEGDRVFLGSNRGGVTKEHPIQLDEKDFAYIRGFSHVHTTNNGYTDAQLPKLKPLGVTVSYDFSGQWKDDERVARVAPYIDFAFLSCGNVSEEEARAVCEKLCKAGCPQVVATRGSLGAVYYDGSLFLTCPPKLVEAVDTLGAGDSFATAFLLSVIAAREKEPARYGGHYPRAVVEKALEAGAAFSARTCLVQGAFGHGKTTEAE